MRNCLLAASIALTASACSTPRFGAVYPSRPPATPAAPDPDPAPSRIVVHVAVTSEALTKSLDRVLPRTGDGSFDFLRGERRYTWTRDPLAVGFTQGRIAIDARFHAIVQMPLTTIEMPIDMRVVAEPVVGTDYQVALQSIEVTVSSEDRRLKVAEHVAGIFETMSTLVNAKVKDYRYDLRSTIEEAYARVAKPIRFPVGDANACATLKMLGIEAGPTVLANGIEKDIAFVVSPSVSMPCIEDASGGEAPTTPLPPLANVATLTPGPFTVTVPIVASYDELARAMTMTFTDGKLFFSSEYPALYLEKPEIYESQGQLVLKLHLHGPVKKFGIDTTLDGDLFLSGHVALQDNEVSIPDLEPTIETSNFLLSLKALADNAKMRDDARAALKLDIGARLKSVREKLSSEMTFRGDDGCFVADLDKIEVTGVHPHGSYLRVYVGVSARARASMPCP